jgi:hypothetical protein
MISSNVRRGLAGLNIGFFPGSGESSGFFAGAGLMGFSLAAKTLIGFRGTRR